MLLVVAIQRTDQGDIETVNVPGVARTEVRGEDLVAFAGNGNEVASFKRADVREYHREED